MDQDAHNTTDRGLGHRDHATEVTTRHAQNLEAVLRGYVQILDALAVATLEESAALLNEAVTDLRSARPTGHPLRHLLGWARQRAQQTVNETANAALGVLSTDLQQQLGLLMTTR